jgi:hypothetical protein
LWRNHTHVDSTAPEAGGVPIDLIIAYTLGSGPAQVEDVDQNQNQRPDRIDFLVNTFVRAWRFYRDELGMDAVGARGDQIGQGSFTGPCGARATWSQSGLTYIYEAPWACDSGKTSPWLTAQATMGSDIAPEHTPQKFPGDVVRTFRDSAGPVPGWGTVPLDLTGPQ